MTIDEYREGGRNDGILKFPGRIARGEHQAQARDGDQPGPVELAPGLPEGHGMRRDGLIELLDDTGSTVASWRFRRGIPMRWVGPSLIAGHNALAVEELEIAHEGLSVQAFGQVGALIEAGVSLLGASDMPVHFGVVKSQVNIVDDRELLDPQVLSRIVDEVIQTLDARRATDGRRAQDSRLVSSVRAGTGR